LEVTPEIARVVELAGGITRGLVSDRLLVSVMLKYEAVALRSVQKFPALEVAVDAGRVTALNPEFVK